MLLSACLRFGYDVTEDPAGEADSAAGSGGASFPDWKRGSGGSVADAGGTGVIVGGTTAIGGGGTAGSAPTCPTLSDCTCDTLADHQYLFCTTLATRAQAQLQCSAAGMNLVRVDNAIENQWLVSSAINHGVLNATLSPPDFAYLGATDQDTEGTWRWQDGTQFWSGDSGGAAVNGLYTNWSAGSPRNGGTRDCAGILSTGTWDDRSCTANARFICESF